MRRALALLTSVLAVASLLAFSPARVADGEVPITLEVAPTEGRTNSTITVSGSGCYLPDGVTGADGLLLRLVTPAGTSAASATIPVGRDGSWNGPFTVPGDLPAGEYLVQGTCIAPMYEDLGVVEGGTFTVTGPGPAAAESAATEAITSPQQIEPYPQYDGQSNCSPTAKPGMLAFRDMVMAEYPSTGSYGISRDCGIGGTSEHKEGRAWDWAVNANSQADRQIVDEVVDWLLATDQYGHRHAMARRLGIMYIIWNRRIFKLYRAGEGWTSYSGSSPHTDHVHFSLTRAGGAKQTSFWQFDFPGPGEPPGVAGFSDVRPGVWYQSALEWSAAAGVVSGFPNGTFRPKSNINRAQTVAWIWEQAGQPAAGQATSFPDVPEGAWYGDALDWAVEQGIVTAFGDGTFKPKRTLSRGQLVAMLWRYAERPAPWEASPFTDTTANNDATQAAAWASSLGYVTGFPDGTFQPTELVNRAQTVAWLHGARQFIDVGPRAWFTPAVNWGRFRSVLGGDAQHAYRPGADMSRGDAVTALWWAMDRPPASTPHGFTDVPANGSDLARAVKWASEVGIINGYPDDTFRSGVALNRGQVVNILWAATGSRPGSPPHPFTDPGSAWYADGLSWAYHHGIVTGYDDGTYKGNQPVLRSQYAVQLLRLAGTASAWAPGSPTPDTVLF